MESHQKQFILTSLCLFLALFWILAGLKFLLPATLPFWIGFAIAYCLKPLTLWLTSHLKLRRKNAAFSVLLLFYLFLGLLLWSALSLFLQQSASVMEQLPTLYREHIQPLFHRFTLGINGMLDDFSPRTAKLLIEKSQDFSSGLSTAIGELSATVLTRASGLAKRLPFWLTTVAFSILCSVFISSEYNSIIKFLFELIPKRFQPLLIKGKHFLLGSLLGILKAYSILLLLTFLQLLLGFFLLRITQPLLWAVLLALLDFLPFIGTGLVLIPWGIYHLLNGRSALGVGLLLLYAILTIIHNLMEPKLLSNSVGLHPILTLLSMYAGLNFFGFFGLLLAPVAALLLRFLHEEGLLSFPK